MLENGVSLIVTLVMNPDGVAGARHRSKQNRRRRRTTPSDIGPALAGHQAEPAVEVTR